MMNAMQEKMLLELRQTKSELEQSLINKQEKDWLTDLIEEELRDVEAAICKLEAGRYGQCEISGELLPEDLLQMIPTLKSIKDSKNLDVFYKKPLLP